MTVPLYNDQHITELETRHTGLIFFISLYDENYEIDVTAKQWKISNKVN